MAKFIMVYKGQATDMAAMSEEQQQGVLDKWKSWMGKVGSGLVDIGLPFGPSASVVDDGSTGNASSLSGYSIVEDSSLDAAKSMTNGHPYLSEGKGDFSIDLFELMPVPFEA